MPEHQPHLPWPSRANLWTVVLALSVFFINPDFGNAADHTSAPEVIVPAKTVIPLPGPWITTPTDPAQLKGTGKTVVTLESGWYTAGGAAFGLYPPMASGTNQGIRATFKYVTGGTADVAVRKHVDAKGVARSYSLRVDEKGLVSLVEYSNITATNTIERKSLLKPEKKLPVQDGDDLLLELIAIGNQLTAKVDGQIFGIVSGASTVPGKAHTYSVMMNTGSLGWLNLDGMSEHKAMMTVGLTHSPNASAQTTVQAALPAAPTIKGDPEVQQRVAEIDGKFRALYDQLAGKTYQTGMEQLNQSYVAALKREEAKVQQKGSLEEVLIYRNEVQAINNNATAEAIPSLIKAMHETYARAKLKLESDRDKRSVPAFDAYSKALSLYTAELTKAGRIDAARQVKDVHDALIKTTH